MGKENKETHSNGQADPESEGAHTLREISPGIYIEQATGSIVVRGAAVKPDAVSLTIPEDERLVEIPVATLYAAARAIENQTKQA